MHAHRDPPVPGLVQYKFRRGELALRGLAVGVLLSLVGGPWLQSSELDAAFMGRGDGVGLIRNRRDSSEARDYEDVDAIPHERLRVSRESRRPAQAGQSSFSSDNVRNCLAPCGAARTAYLIGDSHAGSHAAGLAASLQAYGIELRHAFAGYGCSFASDAFNEKLLDPVGSGWAYGKCVEWVETVKAALVEFAAPDDLIFTTTAAWKYDVVGNVDVAFVEEIATIAPLVVLGDAPLLRGIFGVNCAAPETRPSCLTKEEDTIPDGAVLAAETWAARGVPHISVRELFCSNGLCDAYIPGTDILGLVDYGHLTTAGSLYLAPFFSCALEGLGLVDAVVASEDGECRGSVTDL